MPLRAASFVGGAVVQWLRDGLFKSANSYLSKHRNKDGKIPVAAWIKERNNLLKEKNEISKSTMSLSERLRQIDRIRKGARETLPKQQPRRDRGWEIEK